jgi:hypothetical protein
VTTRTRAFKQDGTQVMEFTRMSLIPSAATRWRLSPTPPTEETT